MIDEDLIEEVRTGEFSPNEEAPVLRRFYVTFTWDDWPTGGSYGETVEAVNSDAAEQQVLENMAASRAEEQGAEDDPDFCANCLTTDQDGSGTCPDCGCDKYIEGGETAVQKMLDSYSGDWHLVSCFDVDEFIEEKSRVEEPIDQKRQRRLSLCLFNECSSDDLALRTLLDTYVAILPPSEFEDEWNMHIEDDQ